MSNPEQVAEVRRWLRFADEDLDTAERLLLDEASIPRHVCWLSQQAVEKALKGGLVSAEIAFPFRHDLDVLRNLLPAGWDVKQQHPDLAELTEWAVEARYPGDWPDVTADEARRAAQQSRAVVECIRADLKRRGLDF